MSRINDPKAGEQQGQGAAAQGSSATGAMREKVTEVAGNPRDVGSHLKDSAVEQYEHLRDTASEYYDAGRQKANQWMGDLQDYVQEKPIKSLLIAAGVGMLLGIIWKKS